MSVEHTVIELCRAARQAARRIAAASSDTKNCCLRDAAARLRASRDALLDANGSDVRRGRDAGLSTALLDRLTLNDARLEAMAKGLEDVAQLPDPVGETIAQWRRPNGLEIGQVRIPLGVVGVIYESRPNVTADAAALCLKAGNAVVLKGGSEALATNGAIAALLAEAADSARLPTTAMQLIPTADRQAVQVLLKQSQYIDVIVPRGGESLIRAITESSSIPVIQHYAGVCHTYVDASADLVMAERICFNAKVQRPGVCNAMETLLVHRAEAERFLPGMARRFAAAGVELRGCAATQRIVPEVVPATEADWPAEFLDLILAVKVVAGLDEAIAHIGTYGSSHTDAIVTRDYDRAQRFVREVDSSVVLVNASTRFNDGSQLGLGAEIGISTSKLHAFGPMGVEELTTTKFVVFGSGQIRE